MCSCTSLSKVKESKLTSAWVKVNSHCHDYIIIVAIAVEFGLNFNGKIGS